MFKSNDDLKKEKQQNLKREMEQEHRHDILGISEIDLTTFELLKEYLEKELIKFKEQPIIEETIGITQAGFELTTNGYKYVYLFVSDADDGLTMDVQSFGVRYSIILQKGINSIPCLTNSVIKMRERGIVGALVRTDHKMI